MKDKIIKHAAENFCSPGITYTDKEIDIIIAQDCNCYECEKPFWDMWDGPNIEDGNMLCEDCHTDKYHQYCPVCENSERKDEMTDYFFISKEMSEIVNEEIGLYKILKRPFYYGDCVTGFDAFFYDAIEFIKEMDINEWCKIDVHNNGKEVKMDVICSDCVKKFLTDK